MAARKKSTAVATTKNAAPPAALQKKMEADTGKGTSQDQDDNLVPLVYVLQSSSPQCGKKNPNYIPGAEPGHIWLRNSSAPIVSGEEGFLFQPCFFDKDFVEWIPRDGGGGFVARHRKMPEDAERIEDPKNPNRVSWVRKKSGTEIVETRYHIGYVLLPDHPPLPYVIPFSSTGHSVSRQWMFMMNSKQLNGKVAPSWAGLYRVKTKFRTNAQGEWYTFDVEDEGWVTTVEEYERGAQLNSAFEAGQRAIDTDDGLAAEGDEAPM